MPVSLLDLIVLGIVFISAVLAMMRGFTREVLAIVSWVAAAAAAYLLHPYVKPYLDPYISNATASLAASIGVVFLLTLIIVSIFTVKFSDFILDSKIGALDRSLGFVFGTARGLLICVIGYAFFAWLVPPDKQPTWVRDSKTKPLLESSGESLMAMLPQDLDTQLNRLRRPGADGAEPPTEGERPPAQAPVPRGPQQRTDLRLRADG